MVSDGPGVSQTPGLIRLIKTAPANPVRTVGVSYAVAVGSANILRSITLASLIAAITS